MKSYIHHKINQSTPHLSYGIILYQIVDNIINVLLVQKHYTHCFSDILRGKYELSNIDYISLLILGLTPHERDIILSSDFRGLWNRMFSDPDNPYHRRVYKQSSDKFEYISPRLPDLFKKLPPEYDEPEWGFPKGHKDQCFRETDLECALRELEEETDIKSDQIEVQNGHPFVEEYTSINNVTYKNIYFLAKSKVLNLGRADAERTTGVSEINKLIWAKFDEAMAIIRPYHEIRKQILQQTLGNL